MNRKYAFDSLKSQLDEVTTEGELEALSDMVEEAAQRDLITSSMYIKLDVMLSEKLHQLISQENVPTVDAVEVVHAEWLDIQFDPMWQSMLATCSHCKVRGEIRVKSNECGFAVPDSDYCPHCGTQMDGGV